MTRIKTMRSMAIITVCDNTSYEEEKRENGEDEYRKNKFENKWLPLQKNNGCPANKGSRSLGRKVGQTRSTSSQIVWQGGIR